MDSEEKRIFKSWEFCCNPFDQHSNRKYEYMKPISAINVKKLKDLGLHWITHDMNLCMDCRRILRQDVKSLDKAEALLKLVQEKYSPSDGESTDDEAFKEEIKKSRNQ